MTREHLEIYSAIVDFLYISDGAYKDKNQWRIAFCKFLIELLSGRIERAAQKDEFKLLSTSDEKEG